MISWDELNLVEEKLGKGTNAHILYFLKNNETGLTKIGITHTLRSRFKALVKECDTENLEVLYLFNSNTISEGVAKVFFKGKDVYREWYFLSNQDIMNFIIHCASALGVSADELINNKVKLLVDQHYELDKDNNLIYFYIKCRDGYRSLPDHNRTKKLYFGADIFTLKKYGTYKKMRQPQRRSPFGLK